MKKTFDVDYRSSVEISGYHRGILYEVKCHSFQEKTRFSNGETWCTYLSLTQEQYNAWKEKLEDLDWNSGQTYFREISDRHIDMDVDSALAKKWNKPYYKIGDDFAHIQDMGKEYSQDFMVDHITGIIDQLLEWAEAKDCLITPDE